MKLRFLSVIAFLGVGLKLVEGTCLYKSACPQSTFASTQTGDNWACPSFWIKSKFSSIRTVPGIRDLDTSNLTAEVRHDGNKTSVSLCAATLPKSGDANIKTWPSGPYCVPSPLTAACPDSMTRLSATVSAAGRDFSCDDTQAITNCTAGSFNLNACCPSNMTAGGAYLNLPVYNVGTFFLLKTSDSCPDIYSYTSREESITIPNATISAGFPQFLANNSASGDLTITFCRYKGVFCAGRALVAPYELFVMEGQCKREFQVFCNNEFGYIEQPANKTTFYSDFCLPTGNYGNKPEKLCGKQCPALPPVANGNYAGYSTAPPAVVRVECDDGHYVAGANSTSCQRNGTWSTDLSGTKCVFAQCDGNSLPDKTTGSMSHVDYEY